MTGSVEKYLMDKIRAEGAIHFTLLDPEKLSPETAAKTAVEVEACGTAAIMVGGSTIASTTHLDAVVKAVQKAVKIPVILFPNNLTGISRYADAIWFMSLLNSSDPYFITGAQILGAPIIKRFGLETIPLGYVIVGEGRAVSVVGRAIPIPYDKPELAVAHALAAQYFGMHFVYLEGGSGSKQPVPPRMVQMVKNSIEIPLIVGGGIRTSEQARVVVSAGADAVVTGTITEEEGDLKERIEALVAAIKSGKQNDRFTRDTA
jgi:phosphoglycerol geranylgeranyltransferase